MSFDHDSVLESIDSKQFLYAKAYLKTKLTRTPSAYYQVLEVYLNYRQGLVSEALQMISKLVKNLNNDPRSTDLLYKMLMEQGKVNELNDIYDSVLKKYPNSPDLMYQWMKNGIKYQNLKSIQRATFHLSKRSDPQYKYWLALSSYLLAKDVSSEKERAIFLGLGSKLVEDVEPQTTHELYVKVVILKELDMKKAIKEIQEFKQPLDLDLKILYLQILKDLKDYSLLFTVSEKYLFGEQFNDFNTWKLYILAAKETGKPLEEIEGAIRLYKWSRNSQLALVELASQYEDEKFLDWVIEYYQKLKGKLCCFMDLKHYLEGRDAAKLIEVMKSCSNEARDEISATNLNILVNNQRLLQFFNQITPEFYETNWLVYKQFLPLCGEKLETDFYVANELILMNIIYSLSNDFSTENVYKTIVILEKMIVNDPLDYKVNLWLMKMYKYVGLIPQMYKIFNKLKIRMIQYDSLGFLAINEISSYLPTKEYYNFLEYVYRYYLTCEADLVDNIFKAFEKNVYNKIPNFIGFNSKIINSYQYAEVMLELYRIVKGLGDKRYQSFFFDKLEDFESKIINLKLSDNRDTQIFYKHFAFTSEFISQLETKFAEPYDQQAFLKVCYSQESLINHFNEVEFKRFNKLMSNMKLPKFESWIMKAYTNLFKLQLKNLNPNEISSCMNYLIKNLKYQKIPIYESNIVKMNYQANMVKNLVAYIEQLGFNKTFKDIVPLARSLRMNLEGLGKKQVTEMVQMKEKLGQNSIELDAGDLVDGLFDKYERTVELCSV